MNLSPANNLRIVFNAAALGLTTAALALTTGCALSPSSVNSPGPVQGAALQGRVYGGQQPVVGATIQLYAVGSNGYGSAARAMIASPPLTVAGGAFSLAGAYTCQPGDLVYLVATGGNPGVPGTHNNSGLALMAGLGPCTGITSGTVLTVNELTTVATVWALSPFMTDLAHIGSSVSNPVGITNAFAAVNKLVDTSRGTQPGPALPTGATLPTNEINTLADILAACVNSVDSTSPAAQSANCQTFFAATTPIAPGAAAPTNTAQAALDLARNPTLGLTLGATLVNSSSPFQSTLGGVAPTDWTIAINYTGGGLLYPSSIATDAAGGVWLTNPTLSSVTKLSNTGAALSGITGFSTGLLTSPYAIAIDAGGNAWTSNAGNNTLGFLSSTGTVSATYSGGGLNNPRRLAIDAAGNLWLLNFTGNTVSEFNSAGTPIFATAISNSNLTSVGAIVISPY